MTAAMTNGQGGNMAKITFIAPDGRSFVLEGEDGLSVMKLAVQNGVPGIEAECGGAGACGTCHVHLDPAWAAVPPPPTEEEREMLAYTVAPSETSRLCCQLAISPALDGLVVRVPDTQY
jgi:2Fe-2S ferredoxin